MIKIILYTFTLFLLSACSFKSPPNEWQYKSVNAYDSYQKNFLSSNNSLAKNDISRAIKHAKMSADLTQLARIYLSECALNISVGIEDKCENYVNIQELVNNDGLDAYYSFITLSLKKQQIKLLPKTYQNFILHLQTMEYDKANKDILSMDKITSQLLSASLLKENITKKTRDTIIERASFNGYKTVVLFWLKQKINSTSNENKKKRLIKKISIMESK